MIDPTNNWDTTKFYRGWIRFHYWAAAGMFFLLLINANLLWVNVSLHRPLGTLFGIFGCSLSIWVLYRTPGWVRDVRRRWAKMIELEAETSRAIGAARKALEDRAKTLQ